MQILEDKLGKAELEEALTAPVRSGKQKTVAPVLKTNIN